MCQVERSIAWRNGSALIMFLGASFDTRLTGAAKMYVNVAHGYVEII